MAGLIVLGFMAGGNQAQAREVKSECPLVAPSDGKTALGLDVVLHYGDVADGIRDPDIIETVGNIRRNVDEFLTTKFFNARIECAYGLRGQKWVSKWYVDIPGLLIRCERNFRVPQGRQRHPDDRYWCISRVDD